MLDARPGPAPRFDRTDAGQRAFDPAVGDALAGLTGWDYGTGELGRSGPPRTVPFCGHNSHRNWTHMKSHLQDIADVRAVVQLYIDGASGDPAKLREAFHPDAHMFGHIGDMATYIPIGDFIGMVESSPSMAGPNYVADVRTVDVIGDAGVAVLVDTTTSAATSSTTSPWRASMVVGGSPTRPTRTPAVRRLPTDYPGHGATRQSESSGVRPRLVTREPA